MTPMSRSVVDVRNAGESARAIVSRSVRQGSCYARARVLFQAETARPEGVGPCVPYPKRHSGCGGGWCVVRWPVVRFPVSHTLPPTPATPLPAPLRPRITHDTAHTRYVGPYHVSPRCLARYHARLAEPVGPCAACQRRYVVPGERGVGRDTGPGRAGCGRVRTPVTTPGGRGGPRHTDTKIRKTLRFVPLLPTRSDRSY